MTNTTHFGYKTVSEDEKVHEVAKVFHSVASKYDVMNDLMSAGLHRVWKAFTIAQAGIRPGFKVLDIAGGTGDLSKAFAKQAGPSGEVWLTDINESMLRVGRDRLIDHGVITPALLCDAEKIPFPDNYFDVVTVAFGLRNMTHKDAALAEMRRVLKPSGALLFVEHGRAPEAGVARWQDRLDPLWSRLTGGCHLNRKMDDLLADSGFRIEALQNPRLPGPRTHTYLYEGRARAA